MARSVSPLCDGIVAVDGAYRIFPCGKPSSPPEQRNALRDACRDYGMALRLYTPAAVWQGNEVEKRAFMFQYANEHATPYRDWFLIMDGDMLMADGTDVTALRAALEATDCEAAEVTFAELAYGSSTHHISATPFRSLFRAVPGLTVEGTHWLYVVPDKTRPAGRRFLWHGIVGNKPSVWVHPPEPAVDVREHIKLLHRPHVRSRDRVKARQDFYQNREQAVAERVPIYSAVTDSEESP